MPGVEIRAAGPADAIGLRALAVANNLLTADEADDLLAEVPQGDDAVWVVAVEDSGAVVGAACCNLEPVSDRVWNLEMLVVDPALRGGGVGTRLVAAIESGLGVLRGSALLVETSSVTSFQSARAFYARRGFVPVGQVPDYYADGDDKVILWKALTRAESR